MNESERPVLQEIAARLDEPAVRNLFGLSAYPDPVRLAAVCARYRQGPPPYLLGIEHDGVVLGCIGFEPDGAGSAIVRNLAVLESEQRRGIGRALIEGVIARFDLVRVELETDKDAVGFYERCGFDVTSLGELYPGTERFRCVWRAR